MGSTAACAAPSLAKEEERTVIPSHVRRGSSIALGLIASLAVIGATLAAGDVRLTNDTGGGYVSDLHPGHGQLPTPTRS